MKSFRLTESAVKDLARLHGTPLLVVSLAQVEENYRFLRAHLPRVQVFYAMKANPAPCIVEALARLGASFDVASDGEMRQLAAMGVDGSRMIYANPFKTLRGLETARTLGTCKFTFDSEGEIAKMAEHVPGASVLLRVKVENSKALVDLNKKFGAAASDALRLLRLAKAAGLDAAGLCFHVGSQAPSADAYLDALASCRALFDEAAAAGIDLRILDIGGGLPIPAAGMAVDLPEIAGQIRARLDALFPETEIWAEPGRFLCGTAVNLITSIIGADRRGEKPWYFLDDGLYGTFSGILFDHWEYEMEFFRQGKRESSVFAGPSCDSLDVLYWDKEAPPLAIGDLALVLRCGAYSSASATEFNGFAKTPMVVWETREKS